MFSERIKKHREELGLSQARLAQAAGMSALYIHQIETGRANPSVATLRALGAILGFELELRAVSTDWDTLAAHGAPLLSKNHDEIVPTAEGLVRALNLAALELASGNPVPDRSRRLVAVQALCWAIQSEFPSFFKRNFGRAPLIFRLLPKNPRGELIKLRRIAAARLVEYL